MTATYLLVAVGLLLANGFFVAVEFAVLASRRTKLETMADEGSAAARVALQSLGDVNRQLAGAQLGITIASLLLGFVAEPAVARLVEGAIESVVELPAGVLHSVGFAVALLIVVLLHMVVGEMVPKNIAIAAPERTLLALALPNRAYVWTVRPVLAVLNGLGNWVVRRFGVEPRDEIGTTASAEELLLVLAASRDEGLIEDVAHQLMSGALDLGVRRLGDVTVPIEQVVWIRREATAAEAEALVDRSGHTRLVVIGDEPDDVLGFVHAKDLLTVPAGARDRPLPLSRVRRMLVLPATTSLDDALLMMRRNRIQMATVTDERGQSIGIVTLEDVIEALVGDIRDESDR
ncbi:MAG TPA: hemolysin family protein [Acidimicrobiales bacterium]|nr:hemolysin family protein [Acidimicrobiales bacterium]